MGPVFQRQASRKHYSIFLKTKHRTMAASPEFDTLELRNRDVTEIYSPVADLGQDKKEDEENKENEEKKFDELELRNRTVIETLSPVEDLGQDKKEEDEEEEEQEESEEEEDEVEDEEEESVSEEEEQEKYDTLHLRKRVVTEIYSPVDDLGQDPSHKTPKYDTLDLRNREVTETLSPMA